MIVFVLCMNLNITSPKRLAILPAGLYNVELILSPQMGLYSNLLAQIVSQLVSHAQIHYHRKVVAETTSQVGDGKSTTTQEQGNPRRPAVLLGRLTPRNRAGDVSKGAGSAQ